MQRYMFMLLNLCSRVVHGSDVPAGRVGSGRVGSGRVGSRFAGFRRIRSGRVSISGFLVFTDYFLVPQS